VATALAGAAGSVTVVINGGEITLEDIRQSLAARRPVLVVAGTGRVADLLADARRTPAAAATRDRTLAESPLLHVVQAMAAPARLAAAITALIPSGTGVEGR
jgi:hypothetical protein